MNRSTAPTLTAAGHIDEFNVVGILSSVPYDAHRSVPKGAMLSFRGWAVVNEDPARANGVYVRIDDGPRLEALADAERRRDVAEFFKNEAFAASGFLGVLSTAHLCPGAHLITFAVRIDDGRVIPVADCRGFSIAASPEPGELAGLTSGSPTPGADERSDAVKAHIDEVAVVGRDGAVLPDLPGLRLKRGERLFVRGWAIDEANGETAGVVDVCVDDLPPIPAVYGLDRSDVAAAFDDPNLIACGFNALVSTASMPAGTRTLALHVVDRSGRRRYEAPQHIEFTLAETT